MSSKDWIEIIKSGVRAVVTIVFAIVWVVRGMEQGIWEADTFTYLLAGMLVWYFGESVMLGILNRVTIRKY